MSDLYENTVSGELWSRYPSGVIYPATSALSALYLKYYAIDQIFYNELKNNNITRFDYFYDSIFIETSRGFIFDKLIFENNSYKPSNNDNHLVITSQDNKTQPDYWLDETNKKIYVVFTKIKEWLVNKLIINVSVQQFDISQNLLYTKLNFDINVNISNNHYYSEPSLEPAKISYNIDTKTFNVSFICRGNNQEFGLISINLSKGQTLEIDEINCFLPFIKNKTINVDVILNKTLETDFYS